MLQTIYSMKITSNRVMFQSPYGGIGASDAIETLIVKGVLKKFQSPYGGIGTSDTARVVFTAPTMTCFNHLAVV